VISDENREPMPHHIIVKEPLNNLGKSTDTIYAEGASCFEGFMSIPFKVQLKDLQKFSHRLMPGTAAHEELMWEIERCKKKRRDLAYDISIGVAIIMVMIAFAIACYVNI
jgi:hypothetical protein